MFSEIFVKETLQKGCQKPFCLTTSKLGTNIFLKRKQKFFNNFWNLGETFPEVMSKLCSTCPKEHLEERKFFEQMKDW